MPAGRPSEYNAEIAGLICDRLASGETLRAICRDDAMPVHKTVYRWMREQEEFSAQYALAREVQADNWADEIVEIADDGTNDFMAGRATRLEGVYGLTEHETETRFQAEHVQRSKLRVEARKWLMAKAAPKKYGERIHQEHTGLNGAPLVPVLNVRLSGA